MGLKKREPIRVVAAVIFHLGKLFLAKREGGKLDGYWEFPGGKVEPGESDRKALRRELFEELQMSISVGQHLFSKVHKFDGGAIDLHLYSARVKNARFKLTEHSAGQWILLSELRKFDLAPADRPAVQSINRWFKKNSVR